MEKVAGRSNMLRALHRVVSNPETRREHEARDTNGTGPLNPSRIFNLLIF